MTLSKLMINRKRGGDKPCVMKLVSLEGNSLVGIGDFVNGHARKGQRL